MTRRIPEQLIRDLMSECLTRQRENAAIGYLERMDKDLLRWSYELARSTLHEKAGYELGAMNRSGNPRQWSQDFRMQVIAASEVIEEHQMENGK